MKTTLWILKCLIPAAIVFALTLAVYRHPVRLVVQGNDSLALVYRPVIGPYAKARETMTDVKSKITRLGIDCRATFGEFFGNRYREDGPQLHSNAGCVIDQANLSSHPELHDGFEARPLDETPTLNAFFSKAEAAVHESADRWLSENGYALTMPVIEMYWSGIDVQYLYKLEKKPVARAQTSERSKRPVVARFTGSRI